MIEGQSLGLGIGFLIFGLVFVLLVWLLLRVVPQVRPAVQEPPRQVFSQIQSHEEAILIVQTGGRVMQINEVGREWFDLFEGETPNIERLGRRVRPSESFLEICAAEGQTRFSVNGRLVDAFSYHVPGAVSSVLVALRRADSAGSAATTEEYSRETLHPNALRTVTDFSETVASNLDLKKVLQTILSNLEQMVPSDYLEIKVWNNFEKRLVAYRLGGPSGTARTLQQVGQSHFGAYESRLLDEQQELYIANTRLSAVPYDPTGVNIPPMGAYIGVPLLVEKNLIGTIEVGVTPTNGFSNEDLNILKLVSGQVAYAIRNALIYEKQERWNTQLAGLDQLAQTAATANEFGELFSKLVNSLVGLFDVGILGFLLYDQQRNLLEARSPFHGLSNQFVNLYRTTIKNDSPAAQYIDRQEILETRNAAQDPVWGELGLQDLAQAASMRDTLFVPLVSSNRFLGYLQLSNWQGSEAGLDREEFRLVNIAAGQVASIIENALLANQARIRNQRLESMRRIASLVSSEASLDEILRFSVQEIAILLQADQASIFLLDEREGIMRAHVPSLFGVRDSLVESLSQINVRPAAYHVTVAGSQRPFMSGDVSSDRRVFGLYRPLIRGAGSASAIVVPIVMRGRGVGELMLSSTKLNAFTNSDMQLVSTLATQLGIALENAQLTSQTDEQLRRRAEMLTSISRISRELSVTTDIKDLLRIVHEEALRVTRADCGSTVFFEDTREEGEPFKVLMSLGHSVREGFPARANKALEQADVIREQFTEERQPHEGILQALAIPIAYQQETYGFFDLHSKDENGFDEIDIELLRSLSVQAAIALANAFRNRDQQRRAELLNRRTQTLLQLFETSQALRVDQPLEDALHLIANGIVEATPFSIVLISLYDSETGQLNRVTHAGLTDDVWETVSAHPQPWNSVQQLMREDFKIGNLYFIPNDQAPVIPSDVQFITSLAEAASDQPNAWHPDDALIIPIQSTQGEPLGLISVDAPRNGMRPDRSTYESLEVFAVQAALTVSSGGKIKEYKTQIDDLSSEVQRQKSLVQFSQRSLPMLLHKDLEQTISVTNLNQRTRQIRAGLQVIEAISKQVDSNIALQTLGKQLLTSLNMTISMVARNTSEGPRITDTYGNLPRGTNLEALFGQKNPLRTSLQTGETIVAINVDEDENWHDTPFLSALKTKSFICMPVMVNGEPVAAVMGVDTEPMMGLAQDDKQVFYQISRQISIIVQNIQLLGETRQRLSEVNLLLDFSRQLSGLTPQEIVRSLLDSALGALPEAHAGVVLLWNERLEMLVPETASGYADIESVMDINYQRGEGLPGMVFSAGQPRRVEEVNFAVDYNLSAESLLLYRKATGGRLPVSSMLIPVRASDRDLGVMVLDNFNTPSAFNVEDENLLLSLTQQVALALENVRLVQTTQERAGQLQALNTVSAGITTSLQRSELVASLLERMGSIILYDTAILWLREGDVMRVADARGFADTEERKGISVDIKDSALLEEMTRASQPILVGDVSTDARFSSLVEKRNLTWLGVPLLAKGQVIGVIALEKAEANYYVDDEVQLVATFASQAAVALDNANLFEESIRRAADLDERSRRLGLLNKFSSELSGLLNADQVLSLTATHMIQALDAQNGLVILIDQSNQGFLMSVVPEESGNPPIYRAVPEAPLFQEIRQTLSVYSTENIDGDEAVGPLAELLQGAVSLLVLPVASSQNLYLVLIPSAEPRRFSSTEIELARTMGNQAAIALENADLYQSTVATAERLSMLNQASFEVSGKLDPEEVYVAIHEAINRLMPVDAIVITLLDDDTNEIEGVYVHDFGQRINGVRVPYGQGLSGKVIDTGEPILILDAADAESQGGITVGERGTPHSIIAVPMFSGGKAIGALSAQSYMFNAYSDSDLQILGTLANQAIVSIKNGQLFAQTQQLAATLEQRVVERTAELEREQRNTETLLRILTEVSASLDLDRALSRTLALLNEAIGGEQGTILLIHPEDNMLHYRAGYGYVTDVHQGNATLKLKIGEGLAGWVVKNRQSVLVDDLFLDPRWIVSQGSQDHRSAVVAPLTVGEDVIGSIMVFHRHVGYFNEDALEMVKAIGSQVAIAINNAQLYELIRDQAERLGSMLRSQQVEASRQTAILEAVADGVIVTDPQNHVSFLNASAERILSLRSDEMAGKPLENFAGLFGKTTQAWVQAIHNWSENPGDSHAGETYAEQLTLDNGRIIMVNLAPVIWRKEFLGTVSIFRDITHEVEVDRLKSEFVATVSHELRTPMTSIRGYVDVLLMGAAGALNENQTHFLDIVKGNIERLNILVNDLLDISRIEAGRVTLSLQPIDLREVADEVVTDVLRRAEEENKPMQVKISGVKKLPRVLADPERLRQIVGNLVDNAYNYTPANGKINIQIKRSNGTVQMDVQDSGIGIPLEQQDRIFERFFRGEDPLVLATPGTGLGLPIVKQLVEMHQGKIWMTSKGIPGEGSIFSFTLPVDEVEE